jgi:YD repeat-containing protein
VTEKITYAIVGGPPDCWNNLLVFWNGVEQNEIIEVNTEEGWAIRYKRDHFNRLMTEIDENGDTVCVKERIEGKFELKLRGSF